MSTGLHTKIPAYFKENIQRAIDFFSTTYDNILGDFNMTDNEASIGSLMEDNGIVSLINSPTSSKSANGRCIDLIIVASAAIRLRQGSVTSIIWCIPSSKLPMKDNHQTMLAIVDIGIS